MPNRLSLQMDAYHRTKKFYFQESGATSLEGSYIMYWLNL
jgi:hypothetical protein